MSFRPGTMLSWLHDWQMIIYHFMQILFFRAIINRFCCALYTIWSGILKQTHSCFLPNRFQFEHTFNFKITYVFSCENLHHMKSITHTYTNCIYRIIWFFLQRDFLICILRIRFAPECSKSSRHLCTVHCIREQYLKLNSFLISFIYELEW